MAKLPKDTIFHYKDDGKCGVILTMTELIRCKDCKHWAIHKRLDIPWCRCLHSDMGADDYCSYAELRGESDDN